MAEDPIGLAGGDVSFYRYVANDPVNWVDTEGLLELRPNPKYSPNGDPRAPWVKKGDAVIKEAIKFAGHIVSGVPKPVTFLGNIAGGTLGAVGWILTHPTPLADGTLPSWDKNGNGVPNTLEAPPIGSIERDPC